MDYGTGPRKPEPKKRRRAEVIQRVACAGGVREGDEVLILIFKGHDLSFARSLETHLLSEITGSA